MSAIELFTAIKAADIARVEALLAADPALAAAHDESGLSAVLTAVYWGQPEALAALLARGPALSYFEAAAIGDTARVAAMLDERPELLESHAADGYFALGLASYFGHAELAALLIGRGADVNRRAANDTRVAALHAACAGQHLAIARMLLAAGAEVNAAQQSGFTPLHAAAQNGQADLVELLLAAGADPALTTAEGHAPADLARAAGHLALAERL